MSRVVHLPSGRQGTAQERVILADYVTVDWDGGGSSKVDETELRTLGTRRWLLSTDAAGDFDVLGPKLNPGEAVTVEAVGRESERMT